MYKVFSLIGVFLVTLFLYVLLECLLESALRRRAPAPDGESTDTHKITRVQKQLLFATLLLIAAVVVVVFWDKL